MDSSSKPSAKKNGNQRVLALKTGSPFYVKSVEKKSSGGGGGGGDYGAKLCLRN